ncbi:glycosyltransferase family 4 protein [Uliginosibacterium sp. H1]|uniref:glycosyltransferase family 4 protein n=1 Tax=Uliginosibacterium sp. H1 TaxID=3114757 RepID=UPI002E187032|nr:glycosyltransferase family 4 protein [Uliginosibacterium sp. H1]
MRNICLNWQLGNNFGWGLLGLNVFMHWANQPGIRPLMGAAIKNEQVFMTDPLRLHAARAAMTESNEFMSRLQPDAQGRVKIKGVVIDAPGAYFPQHELIGQCNVGRYIFEETSLKGRLDKLGKYDELLTASHWNAQLLEAATGRKAKIIFEGVDTSLFCPGPRSGLLDPDRFYVFTGGKIEFRKAQDLVLLAFRTFAARHPDAVLVAAWHSPWPRMAAGFKGKLDHALTLTPQGNLDVAKWTRDNGINPSQFIDLGPVQNPLMAPILREMDVALQPSRAEACTNMPAKEAMACAVPVIAGANTGMHDLLQDDNCILLTQQNLVTLPAGYGQTEGWGESDVDEIISALEFAYTQRATAAGIGARSRTSLIERGRNWQTHARELQDWILSLA